MTLAARLDAARTGLAVGPILAPAILRLSGKDARDYLHRMSTQDVAGLPAGRSAYAAFLNAKGHLLAEGHVLVQPDGVLLVIDPRAAPEARAHLEKFVIMDDVTIEDGSERLRVLPLLGPGAVAAVALHATGVPFVENRRRGAPALDLVLPPDAAALLRAALTGDGAVPLDEDALEALRILGGVARWGPDLEAARLPMEAGLTADAISFTKGCYIGQEIVVRAIARGQLQRGLVVLALPDGAAPGTKLVADGQEVGVVTSAIDAPDGRVGLGYLRRAHWAPGSRVTAGAGEAVVRRALAEDAPPPCA